jgi:acyl dehydratase
MTSLTSARNVSSVAVGEAMPDVVRVPDLRQLVRWAGASGDFTPIHYDYDFATTIAGLPGPIVHGPLKAAFLVEMLVEWAGGDPGVVKGLKLRYHSFDVVGTALRCGGRVERLGDPATGEVFCEVWIDGDDGRRSVSGTARLELGVAS